MTTAYESGKLNISRLIRPLAPITAKTKSFGSGTHENWKSCLPPIVSLASPSVLANLSSTLLCVNKTKKIEVNLPQATAAGHGRSYPVEGRKMRERKLEDDSRTTVRPRSTARGQCVAASL
jgi:hypothetical protein